MLSIELNTWVSSLCVRILRQPSPLSLCNTDFIHQSRCSLYNSTPSTVSAGQQKSSQHHHPSPLSCAVQQAIQSQHSRSEVTPSDAKYL